MTFPFRMSPDRWRGTGAVTSGLLLAAAYPPFDAPALAWVALAPLLLVARFTPVRGMFQWGVVSGLAFWLVSLSWLLTLSRTGGPLALVVVGWGLLAAYCALYTGAFAMLVAWVFRCAVGERSNSGPEPAAPGPLWSAALVAIIPAAWIGCEYIRSTLCTGFPWNALGVSQYANLTMIQGAAWGGVYAVSGVVMIPNVLLALTTLRFIGNRRGEPQPILKLDMVIGMLACVLYWYSGSRVLQRINVEQMRWRGVRIAAIQPNIPQIKKWSSDAEAERFTAEIFESLQSQTEMAILTRPELIVWPETCLPDALGSDPASTDFVRSMATNGIPLLAGSIELGPPVGRWPGLYNSSFLIGPEGDVLDVYRKIHLVPFGEYLPFENQLPIIKSLAPLGFSCLPGKNPTVFHLEHPPLAFAAMICFEDSFSDIARRFVRAGARLLVNQTNDAWFDGSCGARQHLSHCVFRCIENRVPAVRVANTGITCFLDASGRMDVLVNDAGSFRFRGFKTGYIRFPDVNRPPTLYSRWGDLLLGIPCGVLAAAAFLLVLVLERRRMEPTSNQGAQS